MTSFHESHCSKEFIFPLDHGPHKDFKTEWWYYTGNLEAETGEEFGYQITIFRNGLVETSGLLLKLILGKVNKSTWHTSLSQTFITINSILMKNSREIRN